MISRDKLREKHNKILVVGAGLIQKGCSLEIGEGWYDIIDDLCTKLQATIVDDDEQIKAVQIKEKFGTLRFYTNGSTDEQDKLIIAAEHASEVTCEKCGSPGKMRGGSWLKVLCDEHEAERVARG